jgi:gamma-glutamyltranspeptidase/glutathione hydrolase
VLQVVEPHLNGPGGEVPILIAPARTGEVAVVCGQGVAPRRATIAHLRGLGLDQIPGTGLLAATVPGAFDAWMLLLRDHGSIGVREALQPAIDLAASGHPLLPRAAAAISAVAGTFTEDWPTSAALWLQGSSAPAAGARWRNPELAATYTRISDEAQARAGGREAQIEAARDAWYRGFVAETIGRFVGSVGEVPDASGGRHAGLLDADDLARWSATVEPSVALTLGRHTVHKTGPWGQGPVLLEQLGMLRDDDLDPTGAGYVHTLVEVGNLAFADRDAWYGDPLFHDVPLRGLLDPAYLGRRRALVGDRAEPALRPGRPDGRSPSLPLSLRTAPEHPAPGLGEPAVRRDGTTRGDTCHLDVVDAAGTLVSATPSGGWLQSSPAVPGLGFCLGTRAQMFWLEEGLASSLRPGARPRTTLSPGIVARDGEPWLAFGTPGGDSQDQWALQFLVKVFAGMGLQEAIDAPAFHSNAPISSFYPRSRRPGVVVEGRFGPATVAGLRRRGHEVTVAPDWSEGRLSAVARDGGWLRAAADPRGAQSYAAGR